MKSLQEKYSPNGICFGCGPKNLSGLRIQSFPESESSQICIASFSPELHHQAFPGVINGGIIGALLDCHSNWTAAWSLMKSIGAEEPPCTVTSDFHVVLKRPTPLLSLDLKAEPLIETLREDKVTISAVLFANGKVCATCTGTFVAVKPGHPAFHRW